MDFRASLQVWRRVLMQPGEAVFVEELAKPYARWGTAVIWLLWLIAKLLGGTGSFEKQSFLLASFISPLVMGWGCWSTYCLCWGQL